MNYENFKMRRKKARNFYSLLGRILMIHGKRFLPTQRTLRNFPHKSRPYFCDFSSPPLTGILPQVPPQHSTHTVALPATYLSKWQNVFLQIAKCISPNRKMYFSKLQHIYLSNFKNVFVHRLALCDRYTALRDITYSLKVCTVGPRIGGRTQQKINFNQKRTERGFEH